MSPENRGFGNWQLKKNEFIIDRHGRRLDGPKMVRIHLYPSHITIQATPDWFEINGETEKDFIRQVQTDQLEQDGNSTSNQS